MSRRGALVVLAEQHAGDRAAAVEARQAEDEEGDDERGDDEHDDDAEAERRRALEARRCCREASQSQIALAIRSNRVGLAAWYWGLASSSMQPARRASGGVGVDRHVPAAGRSRGRGRCRRRWRGTDRPPSVAGLAGLDEAREFEVEALLAHPEVDVDEGGRRRLHDRADGAEDDARHCRTVRRRRSVPPYDCRVVAVRVDEQAAETSTMSCSGVVTMLVDEVDDDRNEQLDARRSARRSRW